MCLATVELGLKTACDLGHGTKKFDNTGEETDDLISIGTVG